MFKKLLRYLAWKLLFNQARNHSIQQSFSETSLHLVTFEQRKALKHDMAQKIGESLLEAGLIDFSEERMYTSKDIIIMRASINVI